MATFIYSPACRVGIRTHRHGLIDVTEDVTRGSLNLTENQPSTLTLALLNNRRKYDGVFAPMDTVVVQLRRTNWLQCFAGYLDAVPYFSVHPRTTNLTATCTLKTLKYFLWDPGSEAGWNVITTGSGGTVTSAADVDGGLKAKATNLLTQVAGWKPERIHIGEIPASWFTNIKGLFDSTQAHLLGDHGSQGPSQVGAGPTVAGGSPTLAGLVTSKADAPLGKGALPATSGIASHFGGAADTGVTATGTMALSGENARRPTDDWYCAMRWPYAVQSANGGAITLPPGLTAPQAAQVRSWWAGRRIVVVNPKNTKAVVLRAADWGPSTSTNKAIDISPRAYNEVLQIKGADPVQIYFAPDGANLGPYTGAFQAGAAPVPATIAGTVPGGEPGPATGGKVNGDAIVAAARKYIGTPYKWGGQAPGQGFDCSGLIKQVFEDLGLPPVPHFSGSIISMGTPVADLGAAAPGDIVFRPGHIAIYAGNGQVIAAPQSGATVSLRAVGTITRVTRFAPPGNSAGVPAGSATGTGAAGGAAGSVTPAAPGATDPTQTLINAYNWTGGTPDPDSESLNGYRALMNDVPILEMIATLIQASQRSFMAGPNGDFCAWFPDYYGQYGTAARMDIERIEILNDGFTMMWDDSRLITHQYTAGSTTGFGDNPSGPGGPVDQMQRFNTGGVCTIDFPEVLTSLFGVTPDDQTIASLLFDPASILTRYGARSDYVPMGTITGPEAEFWYAVYLFQKKWSGQFSSAIQLTFMPEIWPGMLVRLKDFGFQAYVEGVQHTWSTGEGGGFDTQIRVTAPSSLGTNKGLSGLPKGK